MNSGHYTGEEGIDIKDYFNHFHEGGVPSFRGYKPFKELKDLGAIVFGYTEIRLLFSEKDDEHYKVKSETKCKGITNLIMHPGKSGTFNIEDLFFETGVVGWEIDGINKSVLRDRITF